MANDTYSFSDVKIVIAPVGYPVFTVNGQGIGTVSYEYDSDNSVIDRSSDGRTVTSKIKAGNGSLHFSMFQSSPMHKYFKLAHNFLYVADPSLWAASSITISELSGANVILATGVSFKKRAGVGYTAKVSEVTWDFLAADIEII